MYTSQVGDGSDCYRVSQNAWKIGTNTGECKCIIEDGDGIRYTACSTQIFSEIATLESIPTQSGMTLFEDPMSEEYPEEELPTPLSDQMPARHAALRWRGMTPRSAQSNAFVEPDSPTVVPKFNFRKLKTSKKRQVENSEEATMETKEATTETKDDEIELEGRPVKFSFMQNAKNFGCADDYDTVTFSSGAAVMWGTREASTPAGKELQHIPFSGGPIIDEASFEAEDPQKVVSIDADLGTEPSTREPISQTDIPDTKAVPALSVMVGPPGRALRKMRAVA